MARQLDVPTPRLLTTADLTARGGSWRKIAAAVAAGAILRLREGVYCGPEVDADCRAAVAAYGRLTCVSELRRRGVFVRDRGGLHVHQDRTRSRLPGRPETWRVHRRRLLRMPHPRAMSVTALDAVVDAVLCQEPRAAVATLDSALHLGVLREDELDEVFAALPRRHRRLRGLLDARSESGPETLVRLMLRGLGRAFDLQVRIAGVGRVDFVVDGWLIVECDSKAFHASWEEQRADRRRDLAAARLGYAVLRLTAEDIMWHPEAVIESLRGLLLTCGRGR